MHSLKVRRRALELLDSGRTLASVSRQLNVARSTLRTWRTEGLAAESGTGCPVCDECIPASRPYAALLGYYLGDGTISAAARYYALRVSCDQRYPTIVADVEECIRGVRPGTRVFRVTAPGVIVVQAHWTHWPCLFPQHGPGRKHERRIELRPWQQTIAARHPEALLRGLFHSDGSRFLNTVTRTLATTQRTYTYPRWQFSNCSDDIHRICQAALDAASIPWRRSSSLTTSVSTREGVARLDGLIGLKS